MMSAAIIFAINVLTSVIKRWVWPKYGITGVQAVAFALALVAAAYSTYGSGFPMLGSLIEKAIALFALSVSFYEVVLQHIPVFKGPAVPQG